MVKTISNPKSFVFLPGTYILINGVDIYHHVASADADYTQKRWADFGEQVGVTMAEVVFGKDSEESLFLY